MLLTSAWVYLGQIDVACSLTQGDLLSYGVLLVIYLVASINPSMLLP